MAGPPEACCRRYAKGIGTRQGRLVPSAFLRRAVPTTMAIKAIGNLMVHTIAFTVGSTVPIEKIAEMTSQTDSHAGPTRISIVRVSRHKAANVNSRVYFRPVISVYISLTVTSLLFTVRCIYTYPLIRSSISFQGCSKPLNKAFTLPEKDGQLILEVQRPHAAEFHWQEFLVKLLHTGLRI